MTDARRTLAQHVPTPAPQCAECRERPAPEGFELCAGCAAERFEMERARYYFGDDEGELIAAGLRS